MPFMIEIKFVLFNKVPKKRNLLSCTGLYLGGGVFYSEAALKQKFLYMWALLF